MFSSHYPIEAMPIGTKAALSALQAARSIWGVGRDGGIQVELEEVRRL